MKFSELECCPFCGYDEYFTKQYMYGTAQYNERFDGEEAHNESLYDGLYAKYSGRCYCRNCYKFLGNKETNTVSKTALKALEERRGV